MRFDARTCWNLTMAAALVLSVNSVAQADDIDLYTSQFANQLKPNIVFVLDYSGSMNDDIYGNDPGVSGLDSKIEILKSELGTVLDENLDTINAGVASIFADTASGNRWPVSELNADAATIDADIPVGKFTVRDIIGKQINQRNANGSTRTVSGLAEAALYLRGGPVLHDGRETLRPWLHKPDVWDTSGERYDWGNSTAALPVSYTPSESAFAVDVNEPGNYYYCYDGSANGGNNGCAGLATSECQFISNYSGVNSDGGSYSGGGYDRCKVAASDAWRGAQYVSPIQHSCQATAIILISDGQPTSNANTQMLQETLGHDGSSCEDLSVSVFEAGSGGYTDGNCGPEIVSNLANNDQIATIADSKVKTFTVGFDVEGSGKRYLERLAKDGEGSFFEANGAKELNVAIRKAINEISGGTQSFTQFSIDVDKATFSHDNRAFFSLFSPNSGPAWTGNLKGYFVEANGLVDTLGQPATAVVDGRLQFAEASQSFWSSSADGDDIAKGGASQIIQNQATRNLLTYVGGAVTPGGVSLTGSNDHALVSSNTKITDAMMGLPSGAALRQASLDWLQSAPMGDPLHTLSVRVNYENRTVLYTMTNQGFIHAIDASEPTALNVHTAGSELFAFMPERLLSNIPGMFSPVSGADHIYGLDGALTPWHTDTNADGIVNNGEKVLMVFGMRRGGEAYYALDVSNPLAPSLEWFIDSGKAGFADLAQSWSKPSLVTVNNNGTNQRMLVFGGGYDAAVVDDTNAPTPASGNAIYMVDDTGVLRWSVTRANHAAMQYSIASDLTVIDADNDGVVDRIYTGDLGGQVWRVDLDNIVDAPVVTRFADFSNSGFHPFFYAPSVAANREGGDVFLSVALGSGNRTDPLNDASSNSLFMLRDEHMAPLDVASRPAPIEMINLHDATANKIGSADKAVADAAKDDLDKASGWRIDLASGEKSLSRLITFEGNIMATTFNLASGGTDPCAVQTRSLLYTVDLTTGKPVKFLSDGTVSDDPLVASDRTTELNSGGIPSSPVIVFRAESGAADVYVDREKISFVDGRLRTMYWHAR